MGMTDFEPTQGWLHRWTRRNNIVLMGRKRKKKKEGGPVGPSLLDQDDDDDDVTDDKKMGGTKVSPWDGVVPTIMQLYELENIYLVTETALAYKAIPTDSNRVPAKDRISVLLATNILGTDKRPLLTVGRLKSPRSFAGNQIPVRWYANNKGWVSIKIFQNWLKELDEEMVRENRKIALICRRCPVHSNKINRVSLDNIQLVLPPKDGITIQPM